MYRKQEVLCDSPTLACASLSPRVQLGGDAQVYRTREGVRLTTLAARS